MQTSTETWRHFPRPDDDPRVEVDGPDPIRILLIGGGPTIGYGVLTHQLGLGGHLARQISALTGRGCQLNIVTGPQMTVRDATRVLRGLRLSDYDLLVTTFGGGEALALMSTRSWRVLMGAMLTAIHASDSLPELHVFLVGIAPISTIVNLPATIAPVIKDSVTRLNATTAQLASIRTHRVFIPLSASSIQVNDLNATGAYSEWARQIVSTMSRVLLGTGK